MRLLRCGKCHFSLAESLFLHMQDHLLHIYDSYLIGLVQKSNELRLAKCSEQDLAPSYMLNIHQTLLYHYCLCLKTITTLKKKPTYWQYFSPTSYID